MWPQFDLLANRWRPHGLKNDPSLSALLLPCSTPNRYNLPMKNSNFRFTFKPAHESQKDMIHGWLAQDYIRDWIHGVGLQSTLTGLEKFFQHCADGRSIDREMKITQHWIGYDGDRPFVYLLTSNIFKNETSEYVKYSETDALLSLWIFLSVKLIIWGKDSLRWLSKNFCSASFWMSQKYLLTLKKPMKKQPTFMKKLALKKWETLSHLGTLFHITS